MHNQLALTELPSLNLAPFFCLTLYNWINHIPRVYRDRHKDVVVFDKFYPGNLRQIGKSLLAQPCSYYASAPG